MSAESPLPQAAALLVGNDIAAIHADPLTVEAIRREIGERLTGIDSGAKSFTLPIPETDR